jgi:sugar-specific transcriptional regulator TrmB
MNSSNRQTILNRVIRSIITYHSTPLIETERLKVEDIRHIYLQHLKSIYKISKYVSGELTCRCIKIEDFTSYQNRISHSFRRTYAAFHNQIYTEPEKWSYYLFKRELGLTPKQLNSWIH